VIAIDPGKKGGIAVYEGFISVWKMPETHMDLFLFLKEAVKRGVADTCYLEKVHGMPKMGGQAMFNFGKQYGWIEMALLALEIPTVTVTPQKWMKALELGTKGSRTTSEWKNHLKAKAQQLYPSIKVTLDTADALLILHYAKTVENG
jgi:hypothetical protein